MLVDGDIVGCDEFNNHGNRSGNVLRKSGDVIKATDGAFESAVGDTRR